MTMQMPWCRVLCLLLGLMVSAALSAGSAMADWEGKPLPKFAVKDDAGASVPLDRYAGKVVLLNIWASWCAPCLKELPEFDKMAARLEGTDAVLVAVSVDTASAPAKRMKTKLGINKLTLLYDEAQEAPKSLNVETMPSTYIIDRRGVVRLYQQGFQQEAVAKMEAKIRELLNEGAGTTAVAP